MEDCGESVRNALGGVWRKVTRQKTVDGDVMTTKLKRCLTTPDLVLLGVGHMVGSGIYVITGTVMLNNAGPSTVVSYFLAGVVALLIGLCYAHFSVNVPRTGTCYNYVYLVAGEFLGFLAGWNLLLECIISVSSVGRALSSYLDSITGGAISNATHELLGGSESTFVKQLDFVGPAAIVLMYIIIAVGVRSTMNVNNVMTVFNMAVIAVIVVAGLVMGNVENLTDMPGGFFPYGFTGTLAGMGILFYAYLGFDAIAIASEETENPSKSLPIAFCVAISIAIVLYSLAALALAVLTPYYDVVPGAPFPYAFAKYGMEWTKYVVAIGAVIGLTCSLLGQSYALPRSMYAMAIDGLLFSQLTYINSWTKTPLVAVGISAVLSALLAMMLRVDELVELVSIGSIFAMCLMIICLMKIHYMPAVDCPFELTDPMAFSPVNGSIQDNSKIEDSESKPILKRTNKQSLESIGRLRFEVKLLRDLDSNTVTTNTIVVLALALLALACSLVVGVHELIAGSWWVILLIVIFAVIAIISLCVLLLYEHNTSFTKFKVPLFPWVPVLALFLALYMMMGLAPVTWIRLAVWIAIGILFYFAYGMRYSVVAQREAYLEMDEVREGDRVQPELAKHS